MSALRLPDAVFWDWDGTLTDSYEFLNDAHNHTLQALGFPLFKDGEYRNYFGHPRDVLYPAIYKDKAAQAVDIFGAYVIENSHKVKTVEGAEEILGFFHERNMPMGIVSNKKANLIQEEIKHLGWEHFFSVLVGSGDADTDKPSSAPLILALEKAKIDRENNNIWYIGDTENDLACAQNAGCMSLFMTGDTNTAQLIKTYDPLISFERYSQLKDILVAI